MTRTPETYHYAPRSFFLRSCFCTETPSEIPTAAELLPADDDLDAYGVVSLGPSPPSNKKSPHSASGMTSASPPPSLIWEATWIWSAGAGIRRVASVPSREGTAWWSSSAATSSDSTNGARDWGRRRWVESFNGRIWPLQE
ncbi:hypothetical protein PHJA_000056500 [Phtheirospermum japonicum]|uniref:Uncharacterized protein n=1 Tax=Phtheirospermum japonicum TaxID=374723 RepID=A0A830B1G6_9LAMI|nr:hypothetical protein PHJA_000056400 [Phtheirospermum japonicum]GFP79130.1 hypothetical protein PHJA_000056500 [Phtheirospermum japonicum]